VQSSRYRTSRPCPHNIAYPSGNEVSYGGGDWTANQCNYDEAPGGAAGAWTSDGPC
jgi:chitinase